jgi:pimeloyl-ACP methyl ester carboxylesterase
MIHIRIDEHDLKYRVFGKGKKTLFLVHGFGGAPNDWNEFIKETENDFKIISVGIKSFFSSNMPLTFSHQIGILKKLFNHLREEGGLTDSVSVVGQSYGGMLSLALGLSDISEIKNVFLVNPMPFSPIEMIRNKHLKLILQIASAPGGAKKILRSPKAAEAVKSIGSLFHLGVSVDKKVRHFNERKMVLIEKAIERFLWIDQHEDWRGWKQLLEHKPEKLDVSLLYATKDELFLPEDYLRYADMIHVKARVPIPNGGHLLAQLKPKEIARYIKKSA